ncbi:transcriptional regulator [Priestia megaterium]|uniref:Transcriptional regulator n=1 Tax=Priestia megaterium TaxID=1404 RepID=A0AA86LSE1_PRIMG|nr:transcriptional regulator [Priestia megaterium]AXI28455.1 transcriptional regulator [Priestia megaterium]
MSKYRELETRDLIDKIKEYKELIWRVGPGSERTIEAVQEIQGMEKELKARNIEFEATDWKAFTREIKENYDFTY